MATGKHSLPSCTFRKESEARWIARVNFLNGKLHRRNETSNFLPGIAPGSIHSPKSATSFSNVIVAKNANGDGRSFTARAVVTSRATHACRQTHLLNWAVVGPSLARYPIHHTSQRDAGGAVNPAV